MYDDVGGAEGMRTERNGEFREWRKDGKLFRYISQSIHWWIRRMVPIMRILLSIVFLCAACSAGEEKDLDYTLEIARVGDPSGWCVDREQIRAETCALVFDVAFKDNTWEPLACHAVWGEVTDAAKAAAEKRIRSGGVWFSEDTGVPKTGTIRLLIVNDAYYFDSLRPREEQNEQFYVRWLSDDDIHQIFSRSKSSPVSASEQDGPALKDYMRRWSWRTQLKNKSARAETVAQIVQFLRTQHAEVDEQVYAIRLIRAALFNADTELKQQVFAAREIADSATDINVRIAWLDLFVRLMCAPGKLDLDMLQKYCEDYANWWNAEAIQTATLKQRHYYCMLAYKLKQCADGVPLLKAAKKSAVGSDHKPD